MMEPGGSGDHRRGFAASLAAPGPAAPGFAATVPMGIAGRWEPIAGERSAVMLSQAFKNPAL